MTAGRTALAALAAGALVVGAVTPAGAQQPPAPAESAESAESGGAPMLVTFTSEGGLEAAAAAEPAGADLVPVTGRVATAELTGEQAAALAEQPGVLAVEPDGVVFAAERPNDPCLATPSSCPPVGAWHVDALELPAAWDVSHGTGALIAIIDGGVDAGAPDLAGKVAGEIDLTFGGAECPTHGTNGAALAAAATGNGLRIPGAGWDARILSIQALSVQGGVCRGFESRVIDAIDEAVGRGARVVNLSLTTTGLSTAMRTAIDRAVAAGVVVVAAAGNSGSSNPAAAQGGYPAAYGPVIAVGASTRGGARASFSNHGSWVDLFAPGDGLQDPGSSTVPCADPPFDCTIRGTSFSAPIAAGVVALMLSARPALRAADVELLLRRTATPGPGGILRLDGRDALYDTAFRGFAPLGPSAFALGRPLHVASRANDGSVWHRPVGQRWQRGGGGIQGDPDLASSAPGRLDVVGRGLDQQAWTRRLDVADSWRPVGAGRFSSSLSAVSPAPGRLDIFGRGLDGALWHGVLIGGGFGGWRSLGGALASAPDAAATPDGRIVVVAAGTDGALWQRTFDGAGWQPWGSLGGGLRGGPGAVSWGAGRVDVVARGGDDGAYHRAWTPAGWTPWRSLGGRITSDPDLATRGPGTLDVVARAGDHHLWATSFDGAWAAWHPTE